MARGFMTINSRFKPFSYEEMLRPIAAYTDEYNAQEAAYGEFADKTAQWERLANSPIDQDVYNQYKEYAGSVQSAADLLASKGLTPGSRKALLNVRRRYNQEIVPIEQAHQKRAELGKMQAEMRAKDPTTLIEKSADQIALSKFMSNPEYTPATYSGAYLERSAAQAAQALSKEMRDDPRKWRSILGGQYYEARIRSGYRADEIQKAIMGDSSAPKELRDVLSQVMAPIMGWQNPDAINQAASYTARGLWNAIGEDKYQNLQNQGYLLNLKASLAGGNGSSGNLFPTKSIKVASPSETIGEADRLSKAGKALLESGKLSYPRTSRVFAGYGGVGYVPDLMTKDLFDSEGRLRTRASLVREGKDPEEKQTIGKYYDEVTRLLSRFGFNNPDVAATAGIAYTRDDIAQAIDSFSTANSPTALNFEELLLKPQDAQEAVASIVERVADSGGKYATGIRKIKSWDKNGNLTYDDSPVRIDDLITKDDKTKKVTTNGIPSVLASHLVPGQIIKIDGQLYHVGSDVFGSQGEDMMKRQEELAQIYNYMERMGDSPEVQAELENRRSNFVRSNYAPYSLRAKETSISPFFANLFTKQE